MSEPDIQFEKRDRLGVVTLARSKALNALTFDMIEQMSQTYAKWAKDPDIYAVVQRSLDGRAFCAGADIRQLYKDGQAKNGKAEQFFEREYSLNWQLDRFTKPNIAFWQGATMGGGVGISIYGTHRVTDNSLKFAMPETGIGLFPDVGAAWFLNRLPGEIGLYLALTGHVLNAADACYLGLATHFMTSNHHEEICEQLSKGIPVDPLLDDLHVDPGPSELKEDHGKIDEYFSNKATFNEVVNALEAGQKAGCVLADKTLQALSAKSPLSLHVTFEYFHKSRGQSLQQVLETDLQLAKKILKEQDFYEGVRALLIDKDHTPQWKQADLASVPSDFW